MQNSGNSTSRRTSTSSNNSQPLSSPPQALVPPETESRLQQEQEESNNNKNNSVEQLQQEEEDASPPAPRPRISLKLPPQQEQEQEEHEQQQQHAMAGLGEPINSDEGEENVLRSPLPDGPISPPHVDYGGVSDSPKAADLYETGTRASRASRGTRSSHVGSIASGGGGDDGFGGSELRRSNADGGDGEDGEDGEVNYNISHDHTAGIGVTAVNLCQNVVGAGILSTPSAFAQTSPVVGVILLLFTFSITTLNLLYIVKCSEGLRQFNFGKLVRDLLGERYATLALFALMMFPLSTVIAYSGIVADAMPPVLENFFNPDNDNFIVNRWCWLLIGGVIFFAIGARRFLKDLFYPSLVGLVCIIFSIFAFVIRAADGSYVAGGTYAPANYTLVSSDYPAAYFSASLFQAIPVFIFAFNTHANMPSYYASLADRSPVRMYKSIGYSHAVIIALYIVAAIAGYFTFGKERVLSPEAHGNLLDNFSHSDTFINVVRLAYVFVMLVSWPLLAMAARRGFNMLVFDKLDDHMPTKTLIFETFCIVVITSVAAGVIPDLDLILGVSGSIFGTIVMLVSPSLMYIAMLNRQEDMRSTGKLPDDHGPYEIDNPYSVYFRWGAYVSIVFGVVFAGIIGLVSQFVKF